MDKGKRVMKVKAVHRNLFLTSLPLPFPSFLLSPYSLPFPFLRCETVPQNQLGVWWSAVRSPQLHVELRSQTDRRLFECVLGIGAPYHPKNLLAWGQTYSLNVPDKTKESKIRAKGIKKSYIKKHVRHEQFLKVLHLCRTQPKVNFAHFAQPITF